MVHQQPAFLPSLFTAATHVATGRSAKIAVLVSVLSGGGWRRMSQLFTATVCEHATKGNAQISVRHALNLVIGQFPFPEDID